MAALPMNLGDVCRRDFVLLLGGMTVRTALAALNGPAYTHVVVLRAGNAAGPVFDLLTKGPVLARLRAANPNGSVTAALGLEGQPPCAALRVDADPYQAPETVVVLGDDGVVGFFDDRSPVSPTDPDPTRHVSSPRMAGELGPAGSPGGERFEAYPALEAPAFVAAGEEFPVRVGFRGDPDVFLATPGKVTVESPEEDDAVLVRLSAEGATVEPRSARVPIVMDARRDFRCRAEAGAAEVTLEAQFYFRGQIIGSAFRRVSVGVRPPVEEHPEPYAVGPADPEGRVDMTVTVARSREGRLLWSIVAPRPWIEADAVTDLDAGSARRLAAELIRDVRDAGADPLAAGNALRNFGQDIAEHMPPEFFESLRGVHAAVGRVPSLLLLTDELYIPWELAKVSPAIDPDPETPPFLGAQTRMGRWLKDPRVRLPPATTVRVRRISAVASEYGPESSLPDLAQAVEERKTLERRWQAIPLEATRVGVQPLLGATVPGHLLHVAVHGHSDPNDDEQVLLLADGWPLRPRFLVGDYNPGDDPRFVFVFLNACQVGTPGTSLGQAAGFPGYLVRRGTLGVIAPLWEVNDAQARALAESFYEQALAPPTAGAEGPTVGDVLRAQRGRFTREGANALVAYTYYGHPSLRLVLDCP